MHVSEADLDNGALAVGRERVIVFCEQMSIDEIVLPITEPETEWVRGRALQKVSPTRRHGRLQMRLATALDTWSRGRGQVAIEWRFRVAVPGAARRPLVPDIAFVTKERLHGFTEDEADVPPITPDVAVEILSPRDERLDVAHKIETYLVAGCKLVLIVDPKTRTIALHDPTSVRELSEDDVLSHAALPDFELEIGPLFEGALGMDS